MIVAAAPPFEFLPSAAADTRVTPADPATLLTVPAILCAVGFVASLLAVVRVVRDDPARALRAE